MFSHLRGIALNDAQASNISTVQTSTETESSGPRPNYLCSLKAASSADEATAVICDALTMRLSASLGVPQQEIDVSKPVFTFGADSLSAVGMTHWLERELASQISFFEILDKGSVMDLSRLVARRSGHLKGLFDQ